MNIKIHPINDYHRAAYKSKATVHKQIYHRYIKLRDLRKPAAAAAS